MANPTRDNSKQMAALVSGTGTGSITAFSTTALQGVLGLWVVNANSSAGATGATTPVITGNSGAGTPSAFSKKATQADGVQTMDYWEATWSGGALTGCTITISSMPANTTQWDMFIEAVADGANADVINKAAAHTQNGSCPALTTLANNARVYGVIFANNGPTGSGTISTGGFTADANANPFSMAIGTYGYLAMGYGTAVTATAGTVVTPAITGQGATGNPGIQFTVSYPPIVSLPSAPAAPTFTGITHASVGVVVPALSGGATSYNLLRAPDVAGVAGTYVSVQVGVTPSATYADTGATDDTYYWWRLDAVNSSGTTPGTGARQLSGPPVPNTVTSFGAISTRHDTQLQLTIPAQTSVVDTYNLQQSPDGSSWSTIGTGVVAGAVTTVTGLTANTQYFFRINATNAGGGTTPSTTSSGVTTAPAKPTSVTATGSTSGAPQVNLVWTNVAGATGVNIYRSSTVNGIYSLVQGGSNVQGTTFSDRVPVTTNEYYILTSVNAAGAESLLVSPYGPVSSTGTGGITVERAQVYEAAQIYVEPSPGTTGAATKRLLCTEFTPDINPDIRHMRTQGSKFDIDVSIGKEYTTGKLGGYLAYYDLCYNLSNIIASPTITTPVLNTWGITGASGTIGFTVTTSAGAVVLAPASFANAAALQAAVAALTNVGPGSVKVTGAAPSYSVQFIGYLSTGTATLSSPTGTPTPSLARANTATNTRRWTFLMNAWGPESAFQTFTLEKGVPGQANLGQQIGQLTLTGIQLAFSTKEMTQSGDFIGTTAVDPFTLTAQGSIANVPSKPLNSKDVAVFVGTALTGANAPARLTRVFAYEWGTASRQTPVITLDDSVASFSNTVEAEDVQWTQKMTMAHDGYGQALLANLRVGATVYRVVEVLGSAIEAGFPFRFKVTEAVKITAGPKQVTENIYTGAYESSLVYDGTLGAAVKIEIDVDIAAL